MDATISHIILSLKIAVDIFKDSSLSSRIAQQRGKEKNKGWRKWGAWQDAGEACRLRCTSAHNAVHDVT